MTGPIKTAGIAVDDWKLPVFRKRLEDAGFEYEDAGGIGSSATILKVRTAEVARLTAVIANANAECARKGRR